MVSRLYSRHTYASLSRLQAVPGVFEKRFYESEGQQTSHRFKDSFVLLVAVRSEREDAWVHEAGFCPGCCRLVIQERDVLTSWTKLNACSFVRSSDCRHLSVELGNAQSSGGKQRSSSIAAAGRDEARTGSCCRERPKLGRVEDSMHDRLHLFMLTNIEKEDGWHFNCTSLVCSCLSCRKV